MAFDVSKAKSFFFDEKAVTDKIDPAVRKALSKFGAFTRTRAKSSIRKRKKPAPPGSPPSSHVGTLKKLIFFGYDPAAQSVVVGPVVGGGASGAPGRLEKGGAGLVRRKSGADRVAHYKPRPYMQPAADAETPAAVEALKDLVR